MHVQALLLPLEVQFCFEDRRKILYGCARGFEPNRLSFFCLLIYFNKILGLCNYLINVFLCSLGLIGWLGLNLKIGVVSLRKQYLSRCKETSNPILVCLFLYSTKCCMICTFSASPLVRECITRALKSTQVVD